MKSIIKKIVFNLWSQKIRKVVMPVFLIHGVLDSPGKLFGQSFDSTSSEKFYQSLRFLKQYLDFIPLSEAIADLKSNKDIRGKCVLTFDDAYKSIKDQAFPILENLKIPATVFIISDCIDDKNVFWRDQIRYLKILEREDDFKKYFFKSYKNNKKELENLNVNKWSKSNPKILSSYELSNSVNQYFNINNIKLPADHQDGAKSFFITKKDILEAPSLIKFGIHTASHPVMPSLTLEQQCLEIKTCKDYLRQFNNSILDTLCLPFGLADENTEEAAKLAGINNIIYHSNRISSNASNLYSGRIDRCNLPINKENFLISIIKESMTI